MLKQKKILGGVLIIINLLVGANMFILPKLGASFNFIAIAFLLVLVWGLTTTTGLLLLEGVLQCKENANGFSSIAAYSLGRIGQIVVWICYLSLFYALIAAYVSSVASLPITIKLYHMQLPGWFSAILLMAIVGGIVFLGNTAFDLGNRALIGIKGLCLFAATIFLMPDMDLKKILLSQNLVLEPNKYLYLTTIIPILVGSWKFHIIIPTLSNYIGYQPQTLKRCIVIGTTAALIIFLLVMMVIMAVIPIDSNGLLITAPSFAFTKFMLTLSATVNNKWFMFGMNGFYNIALSTTLLIISQGLFEFLADGFKQSNSRLGRVQTILLTFTPPLVLGLFYPQGFIWILQYSTIISLMLIIVFPALMVYGLRKKKDTSLSYQVFGGRSLLIITAITGLSLIGFFLIFCGCQPRWV